MGHPNVRIVTGTTGDPVSPTNPLAVTPVGGDVPGVPGSTVLTAQGIGYSAALSFARTADTNIYAAGDVIGINAAGSPGSAIHELPLIGPAGGRIEITKASLVVGLTAVPSGMANFRMHFFNAAPTAILDNAAFDLVSGDRAKYLGYVDVPTPEDLGSTLYSYGRMADDIKLADGQTSVWVLLETRGGYTPASGTTYEIRLRSRLV